MGGEVLLQAAAGGSAAAMANITYDLQWRECMTDILDQIEAEDPEDEALRPDAEADFFQHFAWLERNAPRHASRISL